MAIQTYYIPADMPQNMARAWTCHSRWCPLIFPYSWVVNTSTGLGLPNPDFCQNVTATFETYYTNFTLYNAYHACCELWCGHPSHQLLQLQCQNASPIMAVLAWTMVIAMVLCTAIQLLSISFEKGWRKVAMIGGPLFIAFIALVVYLVAERQLATTTVDTPFYPIVGGMNVVAFSYYFSSFQYSIGLAYELAPAVAIVFTMFPIWSMLTVKINNLLDYNFGTLYYGAPFIDWKIKVLERLLLAMLILCVIWITHSILYRTIVYKAAWITGYRKQKLERRDENGNPRTNHLRKFWMLAGAQGHPTWRTPAGQSVGLYLAVLSWTILVLTLKYLKEDCRDDLKLFYILLWVPPFILTLGVVLTQIRIGTRETHRSNQENDSLLWTWFMVDFQSLWNSVQHMEDAVLSYRLGRDTLEVEDSRKLKIYRSMYSNMKIQWVDRAVARLVVIFEAVILLIAYPGLVLVVKPLQWLGSSIMLSECVSSIVEHVRSFNSFNKRVRAYQPLQEHCLSEDVANLYERIQKQEYGNEENEINELENEIDEEICKILHDHRRLIRLPMLLDNIGPSSLSHLLDILANELTPAQPPPQEMVTAPNSGSCTTDSAPIATEAAPAQPPSQQIQPPAQLPAQPPTQPPPQPLAQPPPQEMVTAPSSAPNSTPSSSPNSTSSSTPSPTDTAPERASVK